ncbi:hypothetical protein AWZ03_009301 [Drosophila navojoa]|uniref:Uncharacterized protein n=1 Tax=Drosophila navojoa TaxID=7232 RepID=A0A484B681_DRONA|nr:hypothetical protein AWZ03_009301 [Drosophila navojoa]
MKINGVCKLLTKRKCRTGQRSDSCENCPKLTTKELRRIKDEGRRKREEGRKPKDDKATTTTLDVVGAENATPSPWPAVKMAQQKRKIRKKNIKHKAKVAKIERKLAARRRRLQKAEVMPSPKQKAAHITHKPTKGFPQVGSAAKSTSDTLPGQQFSSSSSNNNNNNKEQQNKNEHKIQTPFLRAYFLG